MTGEKRRVRRSNGPPAVPFCHVLFGRLRELDDDGKTLSHFFSLNSAWVQFELPGDVDGNEVSSSTPQPFRPILPNPHAVFVLLEISDFVVSPLGEQECTRFFFNTVRARVEHSRSCLG